jgi:hypothetical protein
MALEIRRKQRENAQAMMRRFQKAVQQSGILLEKRRRQFAKRTKSDNMQKKSALRKIETKKKYDLIKKCAKLNGAFFAFNNAKR